jgi:hypothetical protein
MFAPLANKEQLSFNFILGRVQHVVTTDHQSEQDALAGIRKRHPTMTWKLPQRFNKTNKRTIQDRTPLFSEALPE